MERRKSKRFTVVDLDLIKTDTQLYAGKVVNISQGGVLALTNEHFTAGEVHSFFIPFSRTATVKVKFDFNARIAWCHPNTLDPTKFSVGMEFNENPEFQTLFIQQMVKLYGTNS